MLTGLALYAVDLVAGSLAEKWVVNPALEGLAEFAFPRRRAAFGAIQLELGEHVRRKREADKEFSQKMLRALQEGEAEAVVAAFVRTAAQATTEERMRMLAAAAAGVFTPDWSSELRSRVTRTVAMLEPSDVAYLRRLANGDEAPGNLMEKKERGQWLLLAGCIEDDSQRIGGRGLPITLLGRAILEALATWTPAANSPPPT